MSLFDRVFLTEADDISSEIEALAKKHGLSRHEAVKSFTQRQFAERRPRRRPRISKGEKRGMMSLGHGDETKVDDFHAELQRRFPHLKTAQVGHAGGESVYIRRQG